MWQTFTESARRAVFFAQEEAGRLGENYVSTEHLLLGIVRANDHAAAMLLERLGVSPLRVRAEIERQVARGNGRLGQDLQLTPRAKRIIDFAYDESRLLDHNYIGTEHILLGLVREGEGLAGRILTKLGVDLGRARDVVRQMQSEQPVLKTAGTTQTPSSSLPVHDIGHLGIVVSPDNRKRVEVACTAEVFQKLVDTYRAKDTYGYQVLKDDPNVLFFLPVGTGVKILAPVDGNTIALSYGIRIRVQDGGYASYSGWIFRSNFTQIGPDDTPFPPPMEGA